jgi:hypothetical protein
MSTNSSLSVNGTALNTASFVSSIATLAGLSGNQSNAASYLYQVTSLNEQLSAMSSTVQSLNQETNTSTVIAEIGLIVGILAFIAALAVARRADALFRETSANQNTSPATAKK